VPFATWLSFAPYVHLQTKLCSASSLRFGKPFSPKAMKTKKEPDHRTYEPKHPEQPTSYDTSRPETATPQEVREGEEPTAEMIQKGKQEPKDGGSKQPG